VRRTQLIVAGFKDEEATAKKCGWSLEAVKKQENR
jgi:hypothetical protein